MKKARIILVITLLALTSLAFASEPTVITYDDSWGQAGFTLEQSGPTGVEVNFSINEFILDDVVINNENMQNVILPVVFLPNDEGAPDLPGNGRFITIPQGAYAELRIISSRTETLFDINLAPAPRIPLDTETVPLEYNKDEAIYSRNEFYPENPIQIGEQTQIRGVDVVMLGITPFQYNPVTKELIVYRDLKVEVNFIGGNGHFGEDRLRSRWWDPLLRDMLLNEQSLAEMTYNIDFRTLEGAEYLVICPDDPIFIAWADSIKAFRTKQGILTVVKTITEVGGNNATVIENYINGIMNPSTGWDPAPAAILLLGDHGTTGNTIVSPLYCISLIYNTYCASDNIYADLTGNMMPDVILARITAQNATQLETMVTKFLDYERNPPTDPDFYDHPITALGFQTWRWFQICSEIVAGFLENVQNKTVNRINAIYAGNPLTDPWSTATNTSTVVNYFGPNGLGYIPATPGEVNCSWYGTANDVVNGINNGAFMLQHRDHGGTTGWGEPAFQSSHINSLTNTDLVFVFSINCLTGKFNMAGECFAEKFHRYTYNGQNSGALGLIAASEISYSFVNDTYVWGMYDNMWPDFMPDYGTTPESRDILPAFGNAAGKYFLQQSSWPFNTENKEVTYNLFHHHGDAFTTVFSEMPQNLTVIHDSVLTGGVNFFNVTADNGSLIALSVDGELIGVGQGTGVPLDIPIIQLMPGEIIEVTVTKQNYYRYTALVDVIPPAGPYLFFDSYNIDDSAGNGNGVADYGETISLDLSVNNVGSQQATNVVVNITSAEPYVTITDGTENYGNIAPNTIVTVNGAFSFEVANDVPDGHIMLFDLEAIAEDTWYGTFSIDAYAPILGLEGFLVDDTATGNGDFLWDPGETVDIIVTLENSGSSDAFNVFGELITTDPFITLNTIGAQPYGDVIYGSNADQSFNATSAVNTPELHMAAFDIDITADLGITGTGSFATQIGGYLIEEYFETFPPAGWTTTGGNNWGGNNSSNAGGTPPEARFYWSPSTTAVQRMISLPANTNTTGSSTLELEFKHSIDHYSGTYDIRLETTSDGITWNTVQSWPAANLPATTENITIDNGDVGSSTFQLAFVFDGNSDNFNYWYIDDVILGGGQPAQTGTVAGTVTDIVTGLPIEGADIAGLATSGVDGTYSFDITIGTYNLTCSAAGYYVLIIEDVEVLEDQTTTVDFELEPIIGDFNSDGYVDATDLQMFGDHWHFVNTDPGWDALYDLVPDNIIDAADLQVFGDHWHEGTPPKSGEGSKDAKGPNEFAGIVFDLDAATTGNQNLTSIPSQPAGTMIRLDVYCTGVSNLDTYEFEVIYDETELAYISSSATNPITFEPNILTTNGGTALGWMVDSSTPGVLSIAYTLAGADPAQAPEGDGLIADIVFQAQVNTYGTLSFGDVYYYDSYGVVDLITDTGTATLPVELSSFNAIYNTVSGFVSLCWATSSETDVNGFNIYRNTEDVFVEAEKINIDLIEGSGTTTETTEYSFIDETADPYYTTYYYWLEVINFGGTSDEFGPYKYIPIDVNQDGELGIIISALSPCYPNPSRIGNEIKFNFRVGGFEGTVRNVELKVYNILGKLVAEIVNGERLVNDYTETWNPEDLSNGVYFYQLKTDNYSEVKKMVIQ